MNKNVFTALKLKHIFNMITVKYLCQHSHLLQNDGKNVSVAGLWSQCYTIIRFIIFIVSYCNLLKFNCNL